MPRISSIGFFLLSLLLLSLVVMIGARAQGVDTIVGFAATPVTLYDVSTRQPAGEANVSAPQPVYEKTADGFLKIQWQGKPYYVDEADVDLAPPTTAGAGCGATIVAQSDFTSTAPRGAGKNCR